MKKFCVLIAIIFCSITNYWSQNQNDTLVVDTTKILPKQSVKKLKEITITGVDRKFIHVDPEKTTVLIADNPFFSESTLYHAITKLPNVFASPDGSLSMGTTSLTVQFDGMPCLLTGRELVTFLKSMPAKVANKIEVVSSPGASYDANISGGILNIVTHHKSFRWFSGAVNLNYGRSSYDKITPTINFNGKKNALSWQLQTGFSDIGSSEKNTQQRDFTFYKPLLSNNYSSFSLTNSGSFFVRPGVTYRFKKSFLSVNYSLNHFKNTTNTTTENKLDTLFLYTNNSNTKSNSLHQDFSFLYKINLDSLGKILEISAYKSTIKSQNNLSNIQKYDDVNSYSISDYNQHTGNQYLKYDVTLPTKNKKALIKIGSKYNQLLVNSLGKYNMNNASISIFDNPVYLSETPYDYTETNFANYIDVKYRMKPFMVQLGLRYEMYTQDRKTTNSLYTFKNQYNVLYPNIKFQYRPNGIMYANVGYRRTLSVPVFASLNPNNSSSFDQFTSNSGNPLLTPTMVDNYEFKASAFEYLNFKTTYSHADRLNMPVFYALDSSFVTNQSYATYENVNTIGYEFTIPIPFGMFREGFGYFLKDDVNPSDISFLYIVTSCKKTSIAKYVGNLKPLWQYMAYSQIILPKKTKLYLTYNLSGAGNNGIYQLNKPIHYAEISVNKSFLKEALDVTLSIEDVFNTNQNNYYTRSSNLGFTATSKADTRSIWLSVSYTFGMLSKFQKEKTEHDIERKQVEQDKKIIEQHKGLNK